MGHNIGISHDLHIILPAFESLTVLQGFRRNEQPRERACLIACFPTGHPYLLANYLIINQLEQLVLPEWRKC